MDARAFPLGIILAFTTLNPEWASAQQGPHSLTDEALITLTQERTFQYFWSGAESHSMAARERIHLDAPEKDQTLVTSGGTGFGLMAILVGIERGFVTREDAVKRLRHILQFLESAERFHGAWPHWIHGDTGKTRPFSPKDDGGDLVETSFLAQGLLCVRQYFAEGKPAERELADLANRLWRGIDWNWYRGADQEDVLFWHWSPRHQWAMKFRIRGYNECLITYVLAASSPTHPVPAKVYHSGWAEDGKILASQSAYGITFPLKHQGATRSCGPLFWSHYSFLGLDPRQLKDRYADYWALNRDHVRMVRQYCIDNPGEFDGYSAKCWGLTSSYALRGYRGHRPGNDEGTIAPTAALSSMPYLPKESLQVLRHLHGVHGERLFGRYGFYDAFNEGSDWFPQRYLAIDQGPIVVMIENHRSGLLWRLFMSSPEVQQGLRKLGFQTQQP